MTHCVMHLRNSALLSWMMTRIWHFQIRSRPWGISSGVPIICRVAKLCLSLTVYLLFCFSTLIVLARFCSRLPFEFLFPLIIQCCRKCLVNFFNRAIPTWLAQVGFTLFFCYKSQTKRTGGATLRLWYVMIVKYTGYSTPQRQKYELCGNSCLMLHPPLT